MAHTTVVVIALKEEEVELVGGRRRGGELQWKVIYKVWFACACELFFFNCFFFFWGVEEEFSSFSFFSLLVVVTIVKKKFLNFIFFLKSWSFWIYKIPHEKYFLLLLVATKEKQVQDLLLVATKKKKKVCKLPVLIFVWLWCCYDYQTINLLMFIFWATHKQDKHVMKKIQLIK